MTDGKDTKDTAATSYNGDARLSPSQFIGNLKFVLAESDYEDFKLRWAEIKLVSQCCMRKKEADSHFIYIRKMFERASPDHKYQLKQQLELFVPRALLVRYRAAMFTANASTN